MVKKLPIRREHPIHQVPQAKFRDNPQSYPQVLWIG